jgi:DNA-binding transcriptional regulator YbjK
MPHLDVVILVVLLLGKTYILIPPHLGGMGSYLDAELDDLVSQAIDKWGADSQILQLIEELSELITAVAKYNRTFNGSTTDDIASEIVDVEILLYMTKKYIYKISERTLQQIKEQKLARLKTRLSEVADWRSSP